MRYPKNLVEVPLPPHDIVCVINGIQEISDDDGDMDTPVISNPPCVARYRLRIPNTDRDSIVDGLHQPGDPLRLSTKLLAQSTSGSQTYAWYNNPAYKR